MNEKVEEFLESAKTVSRDRFEAVSAIRDIFLKSDHGFEEGFKYGGITYSLSGELIGGIYSYAKHISIEFSSGAKFSDPFGVLEGGGKHRRHIKIKEILEIEEKSISSYIQQSANYSS